MGNLQSNHTRRSNSVLIVSMFVGVLANVVPAYGYDITDNLSIGGVLAGAAQCHAPEDDTSPDDQCRGAVLTQPEVRFRLTDDDQLFAKFGFAKGNGLNKVSPYIVAPWAADLQDDVRNLNTRSRDYLLTAWYKHTFSFGEDQRLGVTGGIIDSTIYLDDNAYSNDEFTQFMNAALVTGPQIFLPSYDYGGAVELDWGPVSVRGVVMGVGGNDDGNSYTFFGGQLGYSIDTPLGAGTYRLIIAGRVAIFSIRPERAKRTGPYSGYHSTKNSGRPLGPSFASVGRTIAPR